ncbi:phenylacetaldoxime dehydratase family protein [Nitriliruptor alkaliphilus]|uniref:phenylacetaldoxime dehydratase family protein n=1 Tax=Nitriliruptor alkaliphilus TaxID=427918 RepID=UPI000698DDC2|nr:phenylacetaldoxime dehydratase family protein [Nitriliruptor alkaliphilus]
MSGRPEGHEPRFPALTVDWPPDVTTVTFAQFGVQADDAERAIAERDRLIDLMRGDHGPVIVDRGTFTEVDGQPTAVALAYWLDPETYDRWWSQAEVRRAWTDLPDDGPVGYWREVAQIPRTRIETLHTHPGTDYPTTGLSQLLPVEITETHDYWGAARDRIPASVTDALTGELVGMPGTELVGRGGRVAVTPPDNLCLIRTAQDWSQSSAFRAAYVDDVKPVKDAGVQYLRDEPAASGCLAARNIDEQDAAGRPEDKTSTVAWFGSLEDLLVWCRKHPTHLAIYGSFFKMVASQEAPLDVAFWHEISVLPAGSVEAEYVNCSTVTGLLRLSRPAATL